MLNFDFQARRNYARAGMVEWNGIFRLFRFSGILGNLARYTQNFGMKFRKMSVLFAPQPGILGIFGRIESAPSVFHIPGPRIPYPGIPTLHFLPTRGVSVKRRAGAGVSFFALFFLFFFNFLFTSF